MNVLTTELSGVLILEPRVFEDERGFFLETFHVDRYREIGLEVEFVQDNHSRSRRGALRGLHYQIQNPQGRLCRVTRGEVFDVTVDLRRGSPTFGRWLAVVLSETNRRQLYIPPGLAHGFCVVGDEADFLYKCTDYYEPRHERTIIWNDPDLAIPWPVEHPLLSEKDQRGLRFAEAPVYETERGV